MKRSMALIVCLVAGMLVVGCAGLSSQSDMKPDYQVSAAGPAKLDTKGKIELGGSGFKTGDAITLLFVSKDGIKSDLSGSLKPEPVADENGSWKTTWSYGRLVKKKIIQEGHYTIDVVNDDYETLTSLSLAFEK